VFRRTGRNHIFFSFVAPLCVCTSPRDPGITWAQVLIACRGRRASNRRRRTLRSRGLSPADTVVPARGAAPKIACVSAGKADAKVPGRPREQRLRALRLANEVRSARSQLKKDLASGKIELAQIVARPPEWVRTARVRDVLLALPKIGSVKAGRILADCGIAHSKTLGGLTERQRTELMKLLPLRRPRQVIRRG